MNEGTANTVELEEKIGRCEEIDELKELVHQFGGNYLEWSNYINHLLTDMGFSYRSFAERCGFSKNTVKQWCKEGMLPRSRDSFIKLGLGLKMNVEELNYILQKYGKYQRLYPKVVEDAICIFVINHYDRIEGSAYEYFKQLKTVFVDEMIMKNDRTAGNSYARGKNTKDVLISLSCVENLDDFRKFISAHEQEFKESNNRLLAFIDTYMEIENPDLIRGKIRGYHSLASIKRLESDFSRMISRLRHWGEIPNRMQLVAFGIHLNLSVKEINLMLECANMNSLNAKDKLECVLIYALTQVELLHPEYEYTRVTNLQKLSEDNDFIKECLRIYEDLSDYEIDGELEDDFACYVKRMIQSIESEEAKELLRFLS